MLSDDPGIDINTYVMMLCVYVYMMHYIYIYDAVFIYIYTLGIYIYI